MTQDLMFWPSAVVVGSFIKTSMTCSQTGGMEGGAEGVIKVGMWEGVLAGGRGLFRRWCSRGCVRRHKATMGSGHDGR